MKQTYPSQSLIGKEFGCDVGSSILSYVTVTAVDDKLKKITTSGICNKILDWTFDGFAFCAGINIIPSNENGYDYSI